MIDIFDILGPIMVGPSSSHTAGAVRIGNMGRVLLGETPSKAVIRLHGSFAETGVGHGTDKALIAGLLGMKTDDLNIPHSFELAKKAGLSFSFQEVQLKEAHPNSVVMTLTGAGGQTLDFQACSVGGGRIEVTQLDGVDVSFTGSFHTLIIHNKDVRGLVADVTATLSRSGVNIANMSLCRARRGGSAITLIETDEKIPREVLSALNASPMITHITYYEKEDE